MAARDARWQEAAGTVLVHAPGSEKGGSFITLKDETGITNLFV